MIQQYVLGGYTRRVNQGLHSVEFDDSTAQFSQPKLISKLNDPTYVALNKEKNLLFSIHKGNDQDNPQGGIVAFKKNDNQDWEEIDRSFGSGVPGCHISFRESSQTIYVSNYHQGQIDVYQLKDNELSHIQVIEHEGSSVHENQDASHVHYADMTPDQRILFVCDLGTDVVSTYNINTDGTIELSSELTMPAGTGPRHFVQHPTLPYGYIIGELNNTTHVVSIGDNGELTLLQSETNIPEKKIEESSGAAIRITNDGQFLYTSTRFHNVITAYSVSSDNGLIEQIATYDTVGQIPRDFNIDESQQYLLIPHQDSDHMTVYRRNTVTGELGFVNNDTVAPECVCIAHA